MATAKEISDTARIRAMDAYRDRIEGILTPMEMRKKYGVGPSRMQQLVNRGKRLSGNKHHWTYGLLTSKELVELAPCHALLAAVAEG